MFMIIIIYVRPRPPESKLELIHETDNKWCIICVHPSISDSNQPGFDLSKSNPSLELVLLECREHKQDRTWVSISDAHAHCKARHS